MPKFPLLCAMMFLQFFVWGSWYQTAGTYAPTWSGWSQDTVAWCYTAGPIAALISPLLLGLVVDRFFASQRVLALMHLLGAGLMFAIGRTEDVTTFEWLVLAYMLCYMPTLGLTNTVAFTHITDAERQFPMARVFGTLGWIAAVTLVSKVLGGDTTDAMFEVAAYSSVAMAALSMLLPHTPPPAAGKQVTLGETLGLGALPLLKERSFLVFLVASFLICIPLAGYYAFGNQFTATRYEAAGFYMSFGQWAEVLFMLVMPLFFVRLGVKWMLAVGMLAWVLRYALFSFGADTPAPEGVAMAEGTLAHGPPVAWMLIAGILLHGICYDFFFVTGQIYVDRRARPEIRGQAQSFLVLVTQGLGLGLGAQIMGVIVNANATGKQVVPGKDPAAVFDWQQIWLLPCLFALVILVGFVLLFREKRPAADRADPAPASARAGDRPRRTR